MGWEVGFSMLYEGKRKRGGRWFCEGEGGRGVGKRGWRELWGGERGWRTVSAVEISVESGEMGRFSGRKFWRGEGRQVWVGRWVGRWVFGEGDGGMD